jgi:hypothetical protein
VAVVAVVANAALAAVAVEVNPAAVTQVKNRAAAFVPEKALRA